VAKQCYECRLNRTFIRNQGRIDENETEKQPKRDNGQKDKEIFAAVFEFV
jgi:hypothetical protein